MHDDNGSTILGFADSTRNFRLDVASMSWFLRSLLHPAVGHQTGTREFAIYTLHEEP